ncbi:MerR family transcriptional regulator [Rhodococcus sp. IEGM1300]
MTKDFYLMTSAEVCKIFEIKPSTLRKWAVLFANAGYEFHKDENGRRHYRDSDIALFHRFVALKVRGEISMEKAVKQVISEFNASKESPDISGSDMELMRHDDRYLSDIRSIISQELAAHKQELKEQFDEQIRLQQAGYEASLRVLLNKVNKLEEQNAKLLELQAPAPADQEEDSGDMAEEVADSAPVKRSWWDRLTGK